MDVDDLKRLARNPNHIPGIYNYCDRWCERCAFTSRCANFALSRQVFPEGDKHDFESAKFWECLSEVVRLCREMLMEMAQERGLDLTGSELEADEQPAKDRQHRLDDPINRASLDYSRKVGAWFETRPALLNHKREELGSQAAAHIPGTQPTEDARKILDAIEVVRWYQYFIHVKLRRALGGDDESDADGDEENGFPRDADGSAKVALVGLERSLAAWATLRDCFPDEGDSIIDLLLMLDRLRRDVEIKFRNSRAFIRPGFDEPQDTH